MTIQGFEFTDVLTHCLVPSYHLGGGCHWFVFFSDFHVYLCEGGDVRRWIASTWRGCDCIHELLMVSLKKESEAKKRKKTGGKRSLCSMGFFSSIFQLVHNTANYIGIQLIFSPFPGKLGGENIKQYCKCSPGDGKCLTLLMWLPPSGTVGVVTQGGGGAPLHT